MRSEPRSVETASANFASMLSNEQGEDACSAVAVELQYLTFLSHDLNNNLSALSLHMKLLRQRLDPFPQFAGELSVLDRTQRCIDHTTSGMSRLVTHARLQSGAGQLDSGPVRLRELAASVAAGYTAPARLKGLNLLVEIPPNIVVRSDIDLLVVVLQNLIGNSVKYSNRGAVRVHYLEVPFGRQWVLSVSDEGPGIRPSQLGHLFTPFRRGETHGSNGVGLGLAIARQAACALGGHLSVRSEVGIGSTFSLAIPYDASALTAAPATAETAQHPRPQLS